MRLLFKPNFWDGFRVLKPKSRNLVPRNLTQTYYEVTIFVEHWGGGIICNFTQFCPVFNIRGMNLDLDFVQGIKLNEDQKQVFTKKWNTFFSKFKWTPTLRCTPESNYWGDADVDHTLNIGGDTIKLLGGYIPPSLPGFGIPAYNSLISNCCQNFMPLDQAVLEL